MSNFFTLATWPIAAGAEITWKHFEDIRRALFIIRAAQIPESSLGTAYDAGHTYGEGESCTHGGISWVQSSSSTGLTPAWGAGGWLPLADPTKYLQWCRNSLFIGTVWHENEETCADYGWHFPAAASFFPTQVWPLAHCEHFTDWATATNYVVGDKRKVADTAFAYQGNYVGYRCKKNHTSNSGNKPSTDWNNPTNDENWEQWGDYVEVSSAPFISSNIGAKNDDQRGLPVLYHHAPTTPYLKIGGWPDGDVHLDPTYQEYQSAIERMCENGAWLMATDASYFWDEKWTDTSVDPPVEYAIPKPQYDYASSWRWNCNKSAFELMLKKSGNYSWYWDSLFYPHNWDYNPPDTEFDLGCYWCTHHGMSINSPHPVWRYGWRYAMTRYIGNLQAAATISNPHHGMAAPTTPPPGPTGATATDDAAEVINHTLKLWHANPHAMILNDMKAVLEQCTRLNWAVTASFEEKAGVIAQSHEGLGGYASVATAAAGADAIARGLMADDTWHVSDNIPARQIRVAWDFGEGGAWIHTILASEAGDTFINAFRVKIVLTTPPKVGTLSSGGIDLISTGRGYGPGLCYAWGGGTFGGTLYENQNWLNGEISVPALTQNPTMEEQRISLVANIVEGTTYIELLPPDGVLTPSCPVDQPQTETGKYVEGYWSLDTSKFYFVINTGIAIF